MLIGLTSSMVSRASMNQAEAREVPGLTALVPPPAACQPERSICKQQKMYMAGVSFRRMLHLVICVSADMFAPHVGRTIEAVGLGFRV